MLVLFVALFVKDFRNLLFMEQVDAKAAKQIKDAAPRFTATKTFSAKPSDITPEWYVVDATEQVLGRLAAKIAHVLRGKHKAIYTPHMDTGDFIVVTNADKLVVTGKKTLQKIYYRHTGYPGGIYSRNFNEMLNKNPEKILINAVKGMLPKGPLGYAMIKKLKVYTDATHPHSAQQPKQLVVK
jgi:large subunit ribosomal protein L13